MNNSSNSALLALLLTASLAVSLLVACTGDDGDDGGISLTQSEATATATGTVPDSVGTTALEPEFAQAFAEMRAQVEADLGSSPLNDDPNVNELVSGCDGASSEGEEQFQACIDLLELLVAQGVPELQDLVDLTAEHAASEFPDRQDEIDAAAGLTPAADATTEPTAAPDNQVDPTETIPAGTVPIG